MNPADGPSVDRHSPTAAIDDVALLARCMGNASFALVLLNELESTAEDRVAEIARHAATGNGAQVAEAAHSLKGAAGILAAEPMRALAAGMESAGRSGDLEGASSLLEDLRREMARCLADVSRIRERFAAESSRSSREGA